MTYAQRIIEQVHARDPAEPDFHQAVAEVLEHAARVVERHRQYREAGILERIVEPERVIMFRVPWQDDEGRLHVNRGFRVQFSSALGPYKGGLRFHPSVKVGVLKFLAFEQTFKNALTSLPLGGGKGGSDFDPKGRSDAEVMRFCHSFMTELHRYIGPDTDVPAGDIGVGGREIGYLFGHYKRITHTFNGAITGKGPDWGGSAMRPEATGHGCAYFAQQILRHDKDSLEGKTCLVSGAGNVAQYTVEKILELGGKPITMSDSKGTIHDPEGIDQEKLAWIMWLKNHHRGSLRRYVEEFPNAMYLEEQRPWHVPCDCAFPCATQNEVSAADAEALIDHGCTLVCEGANMPCKPEAVDKLCEAGVRFGPAKAANAGGVAVSGFEMTQNAQHLYWSRQRVDQQLQQVMHDIHAAALSAAEAYDAPGDLALGANIAGFTRVADAMIAQGVV
ncbi:MAG: NADP-specific glutamate dehydrogenase [Phycisphaeraceae bacterium]